MSAPVFYSKKTNIPYNGLVYAYNKPVISSDAQEQNEVFNQSLFNYLIDSVPANQMQVIIDDIAVDESASIDSNLFIKKFRFLLKSNLTYDGLTNATDKSYYYFGSISSDNIKVHPYDTASSVTDKYFEIKMYYRKIVVDKDSTVYLNGVRKSGEVGDKIIEVETTNNTVDPRVLEEASIRESFEFTFIMATKTNALDVVTYPDLSANWTEGPVVAQGHIDNTGIVVEDEVKLSNNYLIVDQKALSNCLNTELYQVELSSLGWSQDVTTQAYYQEVNIDSSLYDLIPDIQIYSYKGQAQSEYNICKENYSKINEVDYTLDNNGKINKLTIWCNYEQPTEVFSIYCKMKV